MSDNVEKMFPSETDVESAINECLLAITNYFDCHVQWLESKSGREIERVSRTPFVNITENARLTIAGMQYTARLQIPAIFMQTSGILRVGRASLYTCLKDDDEYPVIPSCIEMRHRGGAMSVIEQE